MAWLAIDAGTSVIKSVLFADDGRELALARAKTAVLHPRPGWSEQDMDAVWSGVVSTVLEIAASLPATLQDEIRGVALTAQGDGCWLVDAQGRPTGNAILWNDGRAAQIVENWRNAGAIEQAFRISGSVTYAGLPNAILAWLHRHQPERAEAARWALSCNGWLFARMTGRFAADLSDASNPFSDVRAGVYSGEAIALYSADRDTALLPPVLAAAGVLQEAAAATLGLRARLPVVMAPYDIVSTAYGAGASEPGQACVILGTTICAEIITASLDLTGAPAGTTIALDRGLFLRAMPTLTGCEALQWAADTLGLGGIPALDELALGVAGSGGNPFFLPYLSPAGERSPFLARDACGSFHGLTLETARAQIARSVYEGLSFVIRECLQAAGDEALHEVRVCGGGARSDFWCQMIADVLGVRVVRSGGSEHGARGAHLYALAATGETASIAEGVARFVADAACFQPDAAAHGIYGKRFAVFQQLRETAREQWQCMAGRK